MLVDSVRPSAVTKPADLKLVSSAVLASVGSTAPGVSANHASSKPSPSAETPARMLRTSAVTGTTPSGYGILRIAIRYDAEMRRMVVLSYGTHLGADRVATWAISAPSTSWPSA